MARQTGVGLNSRKKEARLGPIGLGRIGLRGRFDRLITSCSAVSVARTKTFEVEADQKKVSLEVPTLKRVQLVQ